MKKVLLVGESWHVHTTESKGFDVFSYDYYEEATGYIKAALEKAGFSFTHIPSHMVEYSFPKTAAELAAYDVVMFSDVGANTMNLPMEVFMRLHPTTNKLEILREYVENGGAFVMIGGYLSFQGIQARGAYKNTPVEELLPVELLVGDDRVEKSQGVRPEIACPGHPVVQGLSGEWPMLLGYNKLIPKADSAVPVTVNGDPLIVLGRYGKGRACAFATDCAPHWAPVEFCEWSGYSVLWKNLVDYLTD